MLEDDSWYKAELDDLLKKGASAPLVASKVSELSEILSDTTTYSWAHLRHASDLLKEVKTMCRSQKLANLLQKFFVPWPMNESRLVRVRLDRARQLGQLLFVWLFESSLEFACMYVCM